MSKRKGTREAAPVKESDVQRLITDWLSVKGIWWMRMNTGAMSGSHKGKKWFVRFAKPGTADLLTVSPDACKCPCITWIEVKRPGGKQSEEQEAFQSEVEAEGMAYVLADCLEDVVEEFEPRGPKEL